MWHLFIMHTIATLNNTHQWGPIWPQQTCVLCYTLPQTDLLVHRNPPSQNPVKNMQTEDKSQCIYRFYITAFIPNNFFLQLTCRCNKHETVTNQRRTQSMSLNIDVIHIKQVQTIEKKTCMKLWLNVIFD